VVLQHLGLLVNNQHLGHMADHQHLGLMANHQHLDLMANLRHLDLMVSHQHLVTMGRHLHQRIQVVEFLVRILVMVGMADRGQDRHMVEITGKEILVSILAQVKDKGTGREGSKSLSVPLKTSMVLEM